MVSVGPLLDHVSGRLERCQCRAVAAARAKEIPPQFHHCLDALRHFCCCELGQVSSWNHVLICDIVQGFGIGAAVNIHLTDRYGLGRVSKRLYPFMPVMLTTPLTTQIMAACTQLSSMAVWLVLMATGRLRIADNRLRIDRGGSSVPCDVSRVWHGWLYDGGE